MAILDSSALNVALKNPNTVNEKYHFIIHQFCFNITTLDAFCVYELFNFKIVQTVLKGTATY